MVVVGAYRNQAELRKRPRKQLHYAAWVVLAPKQKPIKCTVLDVSHTGARLTLAPEIKVPDEFFLLFTRDASARRLCRPIWREGDTVGLEFTQPPDLPG
jgi:hypothetical protein